jgi:hypothetical protein
MAGRLVAFRDLPGSRFHSRFQVRFLAAETDARLSADPAAQEAASRREISLFFEMSSPELAALLDTLTRQQP